MALRVLSRLADRGVAVPDEMSVVGFDDIPMAAMVTPHTTVVLPLGQAGRAEVELLLERLADPGPTGAHEQTPDARLIVRASTAPPRGSSPRVAAA